MKHNTLADVKLKSIEGRKSRKMMDFCLWLCIHSLMKNITPSDNHWLFCHFYILTYIYSILDKNHKYKILSGQMAYNLVNTIIGAKISPRLTLLNIRQIGSPCKALFPGQTYTNPTNWNIVRFAEKFTTPRHEVAVALILVVGVEHRNKAPYYSGRPVYSIARPLPMKGRRHC